MINLNNDEISQQIFPFWHRKYIDKIKFLLLAFRPYRVKYGFKIILLKDFEQIMFN